MNGIDLRGERWQEVYTKIDLANEIRRLTARVEELELMLSAFPPHKDIDALRARVAELEKERLHFEHTLTTHYVAMREGKE